MLRPSEARLAKGLYWDRAWSLVEGCTPVSPGCDNCWSLRQTHLRSFNPNLKIRERYGGLISYDAFGRPQWRRVCPMEDDLAKITPRQRPQVVAVWNDLFHEAVPFAFIEKAFDRMGGCKQHLFLVLTKRPERALEFCRYLKGDDAGYLREENVWFGFTAENQAWFDRRWQYARQIQAAGIFLSYEPALGPLILPEDFLARGSGAWVVAGGESGPQARPLHPDWVRRVRDDCRQFGVPFFFKQWGEWLPLTQWEDADCFVLPESKMGSLWPEGRFDKNLYPSSETGEGPEQIYRIGKKAAGRLLDGRTWEEMPHG